MTLAELRLYGKSALAQAATAQNAMCAMAMIILTFGQRHKSDGLERESHGNLKGVGWLRAIGVYAIIDGGYWLQMTAIPQGSLWRLSIQGFFSRSVKFYS